jgi:hypothetical protein
VKVIKNTEKTDSSSTTKLLPLSFIIIIIIIIIIITTTMALQPFVGRWPLFNFLILYRVGRTPWTGDQPVARPLPTHRTTQTQKKAQNTDIHVLSGIRTHDPSVRASEGSSCLRLRGHCYKRP